MWKSEVRFSTVVIASILWILLHSIDFRRPWRNNTPFAILLLSTDTFRFFLSQRGAVVDEGANSSKLVVGMKESTSR